MIKDEIVTGKSPVRGITPYGHGYAMLVALGDALNKIDWNQKGKWNVCNLSAEVYLITGMDDAAEVVADVKLCAVIEAEEVKP